jgi:16S rRNA (guanine527-N7)-methyltransferase
VADRRLNTAAADILGRSLTRLERDQFSKYLNLLVKWQKTQRLVGSSDPEWIVDTLLLDSLLFTRLLPTEARDVIDVGSGAGIPGIPLKIVRESLRITLLEARQKRASFLAAAVRELALRDCRVFNARLESLQPSVGKFDAAVARCVGDPLQLLTDVGSLLKPGAVVIASGPPDRRPVAAGQWQEVVWSGGRRLFWTQRIA